MPAVQRQGDQDSGGGKILQGDPSVKVNGRPIAVQGDTVTTHPAGRYAHQGVKTQASQQTVKVNGKPVIVTNDKDTCGHVRQGGSPDVKIGG